MIYLLESSILDQCQIQFRRASQLDKLQEVEKIYKDMWGKNFFKAVFTWEEAIGIQREEKQKEAIHLMLQHIKQCPEHIISHLYLIQWYIRRRNLSDALIQLEKLLQHDPSFCYEEHLCKELEWYQEEVNLRHRNKYLFQAEKKLYEDNGQLTLFYAQDHKTPLLLKRIQEEIEHDEDLEFDPSLYQRKTYFHLLI